MNISLNDHARVIPKDEVLFREGNNPTHIYLVKSGKILCVKKSKERLVPIFTADPQKIVGEEAVLSRTQHDYSAVAMEDSEIVEISADTLKKVMTAAPSWMSGLLKTLADRATDTSSVISEHRLAAGTDNELDPAEETRLKKLLAQ